MALIREYYEQFSDIMKDDAMACLALLGSSFPAALFMKYIPSPTGKQIFSITVALIQTCMVCKSDTLIPILLCLCSYLALRIVPKGVTGRVIFHVTFSLLVLCKLLVFSDVIVLSYMTDAVLLLMVLRICSYGYDYQLDKVLDGDNKDTRPSQLCSLFDYVGYCFCFVGYWTGPFYKYRTYNNMLNSKTLIRSSKLALSHMKPLLILIPIHLAQNIYNPLDYTMTAEFLERSFLYKFMYLFLGFWTFKVKFYGVWLFSEAICVACNLGTYENKDGTVDYTSILNIDMYNNEFQWELSNLVRCWNKSVHRWMKTYVYDTTRLPKSVRTDFVFAMSAFWHGVRPGYYMFFLSAPPIIKVQRKIRNLTRKARANNHTLEMVYRGAMWLFVRVAMSIFLPPFYIPSLDTILKVWASMYWVAPISCCIISLLSLILPEGERPDHPKSS